MDFRTMVQSLGVRAKVERIDRNPNLIADAWARSATHYKVTLKHKRRTMTVPFSQGAAHRKEPTAADVLSCLVADAQSVENARGFSDWARDLGYDEDCPTFRRTYALCEKQRVKLLNLVGEDGYRALCAADPM